jgi:hypothetical protein
MEIVYEQTKTILTLFNTEGPKSVGFEVDGEMPKFMVVADLFGKRCGFYSKHQTLIREICASFYGPVDCGFGNGSLIRHEIDLMAKQTTALNCSLLLVISAPWGTSVGERFWRLCTVRKCEDVSQTRYVDSEYCFSSMQRPPSRPGSSVLGGSLSVLACSASLLAMSKEWRAVDIDSSQGDAAAPEYGTAQASDDQDAKMISVMGDVIKNLKMRDKEQQALIEKLECEKNMEIERRVRIELEKERHVWKVDTESFNRALECQANEVAMERVKSDALANEVRNFDLVVIPACKEMHDEFQRSLSDLCGKQLVLEDEIKSCNKKLSDARRRDTEAKKERTCFETTLDAKTNEVLALRTQLQSLQARSEEAKRTASEQITSLLDASQKTAATIEKLEDNLNEVNKNSDRLNNMLSLERDSRIETAVDADDMQTVLIKAKMLSRWIVFVQRTKCARLKHSAPVAEPDNQSTDERGQTGGDPPSELTKAPPDTITRKDELSHADLLNIVASTKGLVAHLNSFVEKVQTNGTSSPSPTFNNEQQASHWQHSWSPPPQAQPFVEPQPHFFYGPPAQQQQYHYPPPYSNQYGPPHPPHPPQTFHRPRTRQHASGRG